MNPAAVLPTSASLPASYPNQPVFSSRNVCRGLSRELEFLGRFKRPVFGSKRQGQDRFPWAPFSERGLCGGGAGVG